MVAQVLEQPLETPNVDWFAIGPVLALVTGALVILLLASLTRRRGFDGSYAYLSVVTGLVGLGLAFWQWRVIIANDDAGGPRSVINGSVGVDGFSIFFSVLICSAVVLASLLSESYFRREGVDGPEPFVLMLLSASGGIVMAAANDLIVMFLGLEILSIAAYVLAALHLRRLTSQEAAIKYFVLGSFSSAFFLYGIALVYGATGSTNLVDIATFLARTVLLENGVLLAGIALLLVGFAFKVAAVPFHSWTPDVYQGSPSPVVAFMASAVKAAGFAGLLRVLFLALESQVEDWRPVVQVLAVLTLLVGAVLAVVQTDVKRMMAYSSINHAGFVLVGVVAANDASENGVASALFYLLAYAFMIIGTFGVITLVGRLGEGGQDLDSYRGLASRRPVLAFVFTVFLLAQAGIPLTSGFFAKFYVLGAAVDAEYYWLAVVAMLSAAIAAFLYLRIVTTMYLGDAEGGEVTAHPRIRIPFSAGLSLTLALAFTLVIGVLPGLLQDFANDAVPALIATATP